MQLEAQYTSTQFTLHREQRLGGSFDVRHDPQHNTLMMLKSIEQVYEGSMTKDVEIKRCNNVRQHDQAQLNRLYDENEHLRACLLAEERRRVADASVKEDLAETRAHMQRISEAHGEFKDDHFLFQEMTKQLRDRSYEHHEFIQTADRRMVDIQKKQKERRLLKQKATELGGLVQSLKAKLAEHAHSTSVALGARKQCEEQIEQLSTALAHLEAESARKEQSYVVEKQALVEQSTSLVATLAVEIQSAERAEERLSEARTALKTTAAALDEAAERAKAELEEKVGLESRCRELRQELEALQSELQSQVEKCEQSEKGEADLAAKLEEARKQLEAKGDELESGRAAHEEERRGLEGASEQQAEEMRKLEAALEEARAVTKTEAGERAKHQEAKASVDAELADSVAKANELQSELDAMRCSNDSLTEQVADTRGQLDAALEAAGAQKKEVEQLTKRVKELTDAESATKTELETRTKELEATRNDHIKNVWKMRSEYDQATQLRDQESVTWVAEKATLSAAKTEAEEKAAALDAKLIDARNAATRREEEIEKQVAALKAEVAKAESTAEAAAQEHAQQLVKAEKHKADGEEELLQELQRLTATLKDREDKQQRMTDEQPAEAAWSPAPNVIAESTIEEATTHSASAMFARAADATTRGFSRGPISQPARRRGSSTSTRPPLGASAGAKTLLSPKPVRATTESLALAPSAVETPMPQPAPAARHSPSEASRQEKENLSQHHHKEQELSKSRGGSETSANAKNGTAAGIPSSNKSAAGRRPSLASVQHSSSPAAERLPISGIENKQDRVEHPSKRSKTSSPAAMAMSGSHHASQEAPAPKRHQHRTFGKKPAADARVNSSLAPRRRDVFDFE